MRDTRNAAIWRHVDLACRHDGRLTKESFGQDVVDLYLSRTALAQRRIDFHQPARGADIYTVQRANAQLLFRMLPPDGPVRMPAELEEAVVLALPQPYRSECLSELSRRYGLLAAPLPASCGRDAMASTGQLAGEFGEAMVALSLTAADGHLDPGDADKAPDVIAQLDDLMAHATSLRQAHAALLAPAADTHAKRAAGNVREFPNRSGQEI